MIECYRQIKVLEGVIRRDCRATLDFCIGPRESMLII
jgi:hypothetical protein